MAQRFAHNAFAQALVIFALSAALGIVANLARPTPVPMDDRPAYELQPQVPALRGYKLLSNGESLFVDARPVEFFRQSHILNAVSLPLQSPETEIRKQIPLPHPYKQIIVYCEDETCGAADSMARRLKRLGYDKVAVLLGGWRAWTEQDLPTE